MFAFLACLKARSSYTDSAVECVCLQVVKARGEAMADAARAGAGIRAHGMLSVVGLPDATIEAIAAEAVAAGAPGTVCQLANYLFPTVRTTRAVFKATLMLECSAVLVYTWVCGRSTRQCIGCRRCDSQ